MGLFDKICNSVITDAFRHLFKRVYHGILLMDSHSILRYSYSV